MSCHDADDSLLLSESVISTPLDITDTPLRGSPRTWSSPGRARRVRPILRLPQGGIVDVACDTSLGDQSPLSSPFLTTPVHELGNACVFVNPCGPRSEPERSPTEDRRQPSQARACPSESTGRSSELDLLNMELGITKTELKRHEDLRLADLEEINNLRRKLSKLR